MKKTWYLDFIWISSLLCLTRLLPHPPDFSPLWVLTVRLRARWPRFIAIVLILSSNLLSDLLLGGLGNWAWFTYSALAMIILLLPRHHAKTLIAASTATLGFWLWTNFGVWLTTTLYPFSLLGLSACFVAALPFLSNSLFATVVVYGIFKWADYAEIAHFKWT